MPTIERNPTPDDVREFLPGEDAMEPFMGGVLYVMAHNGDTFQVRVQTIPGDEFGLPLRERWKAGDPVKSMIYRVLTVRHEPPLGEPYKQDWRGDFRSVGGAALFVNAVIADIAKS